MLIKRIAGKVDAVMAMGIQLLSGGVPLAIAAFVVEQPLNVIWFPHFILILASLSLFGTALVYWLRVSILKKTSLNRANAFSFLVPIFGLAMGAMFFGKTLGWPQFAGIALTLVGIALVNPRSGPVARYQLEQQLNVAKNKVEYKHNEI